MSTESRSSAASTGTTAPLARRRSSISAPKIQPTYLRDFYVNGFKTTEQDAVLKEKFVLDGSFDPHNGERGLEAFEELVDRYALKGAKLYTAEWHENSEG